MTKDKQFLAFIVYPRKKRWKKKETTEMERQNMFNFVQTIKMREVLILKVLKELFISILR